MITYPQALYVSGSSIQEYTAETWSEIEKDPRGLVLMWEPPDSKARYVMGLDPTEGITGWDRSTRIDGDQKTDNAAIEIFRIDGLKELLWVVENGQKVANIDPVTKRQKYLMRDVQVCEFAAPCDAVEVARIANVLGRIYCGDADDQCLLVHEAWPGPGMLTTQELLRLSYGSLWQWEFIDSAAEVTNRIGWRSTRESQKLLWYRSRRHLMNRQAQIKSKFLLGEYASAEIDMDRMRARAAYGFKDDRFQAANMCFWAGHAWTYDVDSSHEEVTTEPVVDYQKRAPTLDDEFPTYSQWKESATADWYD